MSGVIFSSEEDSKEQTEVRLKLAELKYERRKYNEASILCGALKECRADNSIPETVRKKLCRWIVRLQDTGSVQFDSGLKLLQLEDDDIQFSYSEECIIYDKVEAKLKEKLSHIESDLKDIFGTTEECASSIDEKMQLEAKVQLVSVMKNHYENQVLIANTLEEMVKLHKEGVPLLCEDKIKEATLTERTNNTKLDILQNRTNLNIFKENAVALSAYRNLRDCMEKEIVKCEEEVERLKKQYEQYKAAECKEYNEVLQKYLMYKTLIAQKTELHKTLKANP